MVLVLGIAMEVTKADYTFGTPTNLGPTVNSENSDFCPCVSADGLSLYFASVDRPGGYGRADIWVASRLKTDADWGPPENLGPVVNSSVYDNTPVVSADELELYFYSFRPGGLGEADLWVTKRATKSDPWGKPENLGLPVNSADWEWYLSLSTDGLELYFTLGDPTTEPGAVFCVTRRETKYAPWEEPVSLGPVVNNWPYQVHPVISSDGLLLLFCDSWTSPESRDGFGSTDLWLSLRETKDGEWGPPMNLGESINTVGFDAYGTVSPDGSMLYFSSGRSGGYGGTDLWQAPIIPVFDLNGDGFVDAEDMFIIFDHWGENYSLCDIGPMPWGDGIVDIQDLIVLGEHLFEEIPPVESEEVNVDENDADSQIELEQGQILVVTLESNPTTGYRWEQVEIQESILQQMGEAEFKPSQTGEPPLVGAGGCEIFRFKAISAGQMTLKLVYRRSWEEGVEPVKTFSLQVVVR